MSATVTFIGRSETSFDDAFENGVQQAFDRSLNVLIARQEEGTRNAFYQNGKPTGYQVSVVISFDVG